MKQTNDQVKIRGRDNEMGIPEVLRAMVSQPFFTTRVIGEGIGMGLTLVYDIITKDNNEALQVDTIEGEFNEFDITLPTA